MILKVLKDVVPVPTVGLLTLSLFSCLLFGIQTCFSFTPGVFSAGASVFQDGHLHRLLTSPFYHLTFAQLLLNITSLAFLGGSLEKGFGTVRFLFLFLLLSATIGFFYSFLDLLQGDGGRRDAEGLLPATLACVTVTTMHTKMTKGFLCGVSFPTVALPWVLLIIATVLVPRSVLPCNIIGILVGCVYGKGWLSLVDLSEARAGVLEKTVPFRVLRSIGRGVFVPASIEERRKTILPQINPTPGSYPVQAYAPLSSMNTADTTDKFYEGWPNATGAQSSPTPPLNLNERGFGLSHGHYAEQTHGHSCNHNHSHG